MILIILFTAPTGAGADLIVSQDGNGDYSTIREAIENATEGDTIRVWEGEYNERVVVSKTLTLIGNGSDSTVIDWNGTASLVIINADWVNFTGFGIRGHFIQWASGIEITSDHTMISENSVSNLTKGIILNGAKDTIISHNEVWDIDPGFGYVSDAIYLWGADRNLIANNYLHHAKRGIYVHTYSDDTIILNNTVEHMELNGIQSGQHCVRISNNSCRYCGAYGLTYRSGSTMIDNNTFTNNHDGVSISSGDNLLFENNTCADNTNDGLTFDSGGNGRYFNNVITNNTRGVNATDRTGRNEFQYNQIYGNSKYGFDKDGPGDINATHNWWGDPTGPKHWSNWEAFGDNVSDNVVFDPWLTEFDDGDQGNLNGDDGGGSGPGKIFMGVLVIILIAGVGGYILSEERERKEPTKNDKSKTDEK